MSLAACSLAQELKVLSLLLLAQSGQLGYLCFKTQ